MKEWYLGDGVYRDGPKFHHDELRKQVKKVIGTCGDYNKFIFGCGVVSYNTTPERVMLLKIIVEELNPRKIIM